MSGRRGWRRLRRRCTPVVRDDARAPLRAERSTPPNFPRWRRRDVARRGLEDEGYDVVRPGQQKTGRRVAAARPELDVLAGALNGRFVAPSVRRELFSVPGMTLHAACNVCRGRAQRQVATTIDRAAAPARRAKPGPETMSVPRIAPCPLDVASPAGEAPLARDRGICLSRRKMATEPHRRGRPRKSTGSRPCGAAVNRQLSRAAAFRRRRGACTSPPAGSASSAARPGTPRGGAPGTSRAERP